MKLKELKFIDLFAGIGGFHNALSDFEAKCVFASEWDKHASQTYLANYNIIPVGDITKVAEENIPTHDILCAGFPCQTFSISGKRKGFADTRGTLFFDIARIAKYHKPKILFLENVKNFIKHDSGKTLNTVVSTLEEIGYRVFYKVLNASHFGLPQNRERIYIVCFRKDILFGEFHFPVSNNKKVALQDFLEEKPNNAKIINRKDVVLTKTFNIEVDLLGEIVLPNRPIQIGIVNKGGQGERIYHTLGHAITLSAYGGGVGSKTGLYKVGNIIRKLSTRECARIQGYSDEFKIVSSPTQAYKQFGNTVAVNVIKAILTEIEKTPTI